MNDILKGNSLPENISILRRLTRKGIIEETLIESIPHYSTNVDKIASYVKSRCHMLEEAGNAVINF